MTARLGDIVLPARECSGSESIAQITDVLGAARPLVHHAADGWHVVLPKHAVGFAPSRRVIDLPSAPLQVFPPETPCHAIWPLPEGTHCVGVMQGDRLLGLVGTAEIARVVAEEARQAATHARLACLGQLAGGIAHDFNNILAIIATAVDSARRGRDADRSLADDLGVIRDTVDRAAALVRQLVAFARGSAPGDTATDLHRAVLDAADLLRRTLGGEIELRLDLGAEHATVPVARTELDQILMNLGLNARDAMPAGGVLTIRTEDVPTQTEDGESSQGLPACRFIRLAVADTGAGMGEDVRSHIFEPYFTTKAGKGSGLGLATVYGIVKQSGGEIQVESAPDRGACFRLSFPVTGPSAAISTVPPSPSAARSADGRVVLVVDDEPILRRSVRRLLEHSGYTVLEAPDGQAAVEALEQRASPPHVLLTDVRMPGMNGFELAQRVVEKHPGIGVVYMTGYVDELDRTVARPPGEVVAKPFAPDRLVEAVANAVPGRSG